MNKYTMNGEEKS